MVLTRCWGEERKWSEVKFKSLSHVQLFATPGTVVCQAPLSMGFSKQDPGVGCRSLLQGDLPNPGIEPRSPALQADSLLSEPTGKPRREEGGLLFNGNSFNFARWEISRGLLHNSVHYCTLNGEDDNFWNLFFYHKNWTSHQGGFPDGLVVKNLPANAGDAGLNAGSGRFPGRRNGNTLQ